MGEDDPGQAEGTGPAEEPHRDTGLELARSIARSLASRPRVPGSGRTGAGRSRRSRRVDPQASGAHPDDRDPQTLDATIGRFISQQGWEADVRVHGVFSRWGAIVGDQVAQHAQPISFVKDADTDGGRLVVQTDSTAWATQMRLLAPTVLTRLNAELGDGTVTFIEVRGPSAPRWSHGRRSVRGGRGPRDTYG
jgi:predicted nucleic acid-binding Zn ribbon protein